MLKKRDFWKGMFFGAVSFFIMYLTAVVSATIYMLVKYPDLYRSSSAFL